MTTETQAPEIYPGYPYKRRLWPAWEAMWEALRQAGAEHQDGCVLSDRVSAEYGLAPATMQAILSRAAAAGLLERESRKVTVDITRKRPGSGLPFIISGTRVRSFYRIKGNLSYTVKG